MSTSYRPRLGTLPANLLDFFQKNPEEELTRVDVASKFGLAPSTVALGLEAALKGGVLEYAHNDDLTLVYRLPRKQSAGRTPSPSAVATKWLLGPTTQTAEPAKAKQRTQLPQCPPPTVDELVSLVVEKGKPIPKPGTASRADKWAPLLALLIEPDTSVPLHADWVRGVKSYASVRNKRHKAASEPNRYTVGIDEGGAHRLWRTS